MVRNNTNRTPRSHHHPSDIQTLRLHHHHLLRRRLYPIPILLLPQIHTSIQRTAHPPCQIHSAIQLTRTALSSKGRHKQITSAAACHTSRQGTPSLMSHLMTHSSPALRHLMIFRCCSATIQLALHQFSRASRDHTSPPSAKIQMRVLIFVTVGSLNVSRAGTKLSRRSSEWYQYLGAQPQFDAPPQIVPW